MSGRGGGGRGRGAYYKAKYGSGRRHNSGGHEVGSSHQDQHYNADLTQSSHARSGARDWTTLQNDLKRIDGQAYGAYKCLLGNYTHSHPHFTLFVDHVQGDAYASPSRVRAVMSWAETGLPDKFISNDARKIALCDFVTRVAATLIQEKHLNRDVHSANGGWSGPKGGAFSINNCGQEVLPRTSTMISSDQTIELRFTVSLPATGRTVMGQHAYQILAVNLVEIVKRSLLFTETHRSRLWPHICGAEKQTNLRREMQNHGLVAFIANGSILPRASGASQAPMDGHDVVSFQSPPELERTLKVSDENGEISYKGMGVPRGITLLTGGGFHGKSTLLEALELGIYNHIPGDGRELVVTDPTAVKIRAEDGRSVSMVDISPFISALPGRRSTTAFSSEDASGSTSMAANIQEALEAGCKLLLIDEDSSATNLLVRDQRMQMLIKDEPIKPLISKAKAMFHEHGVSTIIVVGGLGDWLSVADHIIVMDSYRARYINQEAQAVIRQFPAQIHLEPSYGTLTHRKFSVNFAGSRPPYASSKGFITIKSSTKNAVDDPSKGEQGVDMSALDQVVEVGQSRMIAVLLNRIEHITTGTPLDVGELRKGLQSLLGTEQCLPTSLAHGDLVAVRLAELVSALSRMREMITVT